MGQLLNQQLADVIEDEEMLATSLMALCIDQWGVEFFEWEPETFDIESEAAFGVKMPDVNRDKLWAMVTFYTSDGFYKSLETFIPIANALNGEEADFSQYDPVEGHEAAWAVAEVLLHDMPKDGEDYGDRFSHEIRFYIGMTLRNEGITTPPPILKPIAEYDADPEEAVGASIGPDEGLLKMYTDRQTEQRTEIMNYVRAKLALLIQQLTSLPLQSGDTTNLQSFLTQAQKLVKGLPTPQEEASLQSALP